MKKIIQTTDAPAPVGPYNQAIQVGNMLYISGQIAINAHSNEMITHNIVAETKQVMSNIQHILNVVGSTMESIVKCTIFVANINDYAQINEVYSTFFNDETAPARELVEVSKLPKNVNIEISAIAVVL